MDFKLVHSLIVKFIISQLKMLRSDIISFCRPKSKNYSTILSDLNVKVISQDFCALGVRRIFLIRSILR